MKRTITSLTAGISLGLILGGLHLGYSAGDGPTGNPATLQGDEQSATAEPGSQSVAQGERADEETAEKSKTPKRKKPKGRLPNYYGQIGLSKEQRLEIYGIQAEYRPQIEELEQKIAALEAERDEKIHDVLSDLQKELLERRIEDAKKRREERKRKKAAEEAAEKESAEEAAAE